MAEQKLNSLRYLVLFCLITFPVIHVFSQGPELYGMTKDGGKLNAGVIFKTNLDGTNQTVEHEFSKYSGRNPEASLTQASNGKLYGTTKTGGSFNRGVLFEYDPATEEFNKLIDFDGTTNGRNPIGEILEASNGKLYGTTLFGGANNRGVMFEYDLSTSSITNIVNFDGANNGGNPKGSLMQAMNGKLYGMTLNGGANNHGVIYEYNITSASLTVVFDFDGANSGSAPNGKLVENSSGLLYGLTAQGGANSEGVLFEYNIATDTYTKKQDFDSNSLGSMPDGSLLIASNGLMYGLTLNGGANFGGTIFEFNPSINAITKLFDFNGSVTGSRPRGSLIEAADGSLYGLTEEGGANNLGTLFEFEVSTAAFTNHYDFDGANGEAPFGSLYEANNGMLYGLTSEGGMIQSFGVLFEFDIVSKSYNKVFSFEKSLMGKNPEGSLVAYSNGSLYGMTSAGGDDNFGVLFEFQRGNGTFTKLIDFNGAGNGRTPVGSLIKATNGLLYGLTLYGGVNNNGVLFSYDPITTTYTKHVDFNFSITGGAPQGSLIQATDGMLYGLTSQGGANNYGVLFRFDPSTNTFTNLYDFNGSANGTGPSGSLVQSGNGKLYGLTRFGGANSKGVLFEYDLSTDTYTKKVDFDGANNGANPRGSLTEASNGKLYGMTTSGGANSQGVLFDFDPTTNTYVKHHDFNTAVDDGAYPYGSLIETSNNLLYGCTTAGGVHTDGTIFEFDGTTNTYSKKHDFQNLNSGDYPIENLIALPACETSNSFAHTACVSYTVPSGDETYTMSGVYNDTIPNILGCDSVLTIDLTIEEVDVSVTNNSPTLISNAANATYQWIDCDNGNQPVSNETGSTFTASDIGSYAVIVTQNNCSDTSTCQVVGNVGLQGSSNSFETKVFPNPTDGVFNVESSQTISKVSIVDNMGRVIKSVDVNDKESMIDIKFAAPGCYLLKIETTSGVITKSLINN